MYMILKIKVLSCDRDRLGTPIPCQRGVTPLRWGVLADQTREVTCNSSTVKVLSGNGWVCVNREQMSLAL